MLEKQLLKYSGLSAEMAKTPLRQSAAWQYILSIEDRHRSTMLNTIMEQCERHQIRLRNVENSDLPQLYEFNLDTDSNFLAATIPRSAAAFKSHWEKALTNPNVVAKAIIVGEVLAGSISCFKHDGFDYVGYWLAKVFWGKGIATGSLKLLLDEVQSRPIYARVATSNRPSLRVLQKCGFAVQGIGLSPADDRYLECDEALLVLK